MRLPQRVRLVPAAHVGVDHRHERHRLAGPACTRTGSARRRPGGSGPCARPGRWRSEQLERPRPGRRPTRGRRTGWRSRPVSAGFSRASACWSSATNRLRWVDVEPGAVLVAAVPAERGEHDEALEHLGVGHLGDVAEVGLGRRGQGLDDLARAARPRPPRRRRRESSSRAAREALLSRKWMSAFSPERPDVVPPATLPGAPSRRARQRPPGRPSPTAEAADSRGGHRDGARAGWRRRAWSPHRGRAPTCR